MEGPIRWRVSWKWTIKKLDCTLSGIQKRCRGGCCYKSHSGGWPRVRTDDPCHYLGAQGCTFAAEDKPLSCQLYPMRLNKNLTLVVHARAFLKGRPCRPNFNLGPPIIVALEDNLVPVFGHEQYDRVRASILTERDSYFEVSELIQAQWEREAGWTMDNMHPRPRTTPIGAEPWREPVVCLVGCESERHEPVGEFVRASKIDVSQIELRQI